MSTSAPPANALVKRSGVSTFSRAPINDSRKLASSGSGAKRRYGPDEVEVVVEVVVAVVVVVVVVVVVEVEVVVVVVVVMLVDVVVVVVLVVVGTLNLKDTATLFVSVPAALPRSFRGRQRGTLSLGM